jgi:hypothetical protein
MSACLVSRLFAAGTPPELVAEVAMEFGRLQGMADLVEKRREKDRVRKRSLPRNSTDSTERTEFQEKENPPHPLKKTTPPLSPYGDSPHGKPIRLPDDFTVPDDWLGWAMEKRGWSRVDAVEEAECFCRYWQAKGRDAAKRSWKKTWQNWVVSSRRQAGVASGSFLSTVKSKAA